MQVFKRDFNLQWDQLNDLYNHLTEDSNIELNFDRFRDFIKCLWHNKLQHEIEHASINVPQYEYDFINRNLKEAAKFNSFVEFKTFMRRKDETGFEKADWELDDDLLEKLYSKIEIVRSQLKPIEEILRSLQVTERTYKSERNRSASLNDRLLSVSHNDIEKDFDKLKEKQISSLKTLLNYCANIKNCDNSEAINKVLFEILKFGENSHKRLDDISKIMNSKDDYISFLSTEIEDYKLEAIKHQNKFEEFIEEISNNRTTIGCINRNTCFKNQHSD